jgi:hypothetical protein
MSSHHIRIIALVLVAILVLSTAATLINGVLS